MRRLSLLVSLLFSLSACATGQKPPASPKLPYNSWHIGLAAPRHMEVWVETVDVLDQRGLAFFPRGCWRGRLLPQARKLALRGLNDASE
ncbi:MULTISPECIES: DUF2931 family protein [unclassified Pseudomonas]|uniref:DUF2931 family protein n=1 Tax=unclassified Pseudomonas TaxID=196821 RepID=UPI0021151364|nr:MULTISPECIES: DUF2931 family protein [unclassified Pseudomonas]